MFIVFQVLVDMEHLAKILMTVDAYSPFERQYIRYAKQDYRNKVGDSVSLKHVLKVKAFLLDFKTFSEMLF